MPNRAAALALLCFSILGAIATQAKAPFIDPADDHRYFGNPSEQLFWTLEQKVAGFRNMHMLDSSRVVPAGGEPYPLPEKKKDLGDVIIETADIKLSVEDYIQQQNVAGVIVLKDGNIVYERYELGNTPSSLWISYSVAKSVTSLLIGASIKDGYIVSVDEAVTDYLPRLRGSAYDQSSLRDLLHMASGVEWDEDYSDPRSDINTVPWGTLDLYRYLSEKPRVAPAGEVFNYNTAETNLVGTLLRSAIGNNLSIYLSEKIWRPFGMESDAYWILTEPGGGEYGGSSLVATLRDYARLGLFAMYQGKLQNGEQVLPDNWMTESVTPSSGFKGYGYLWWLADGGAYSASGIFGQGMYINPGQDLVIAINSAREQASDAGDWELQDALYQALEEALE